MKQRNRSDCLLCHSLDIWGDKWSLLIIRDMIFSGKKSYGEFLKSPEGIATNVLATRLRQLEERGVIKKSGHPGSKAKYLYSLTEKGISMLPILVEIFFWAEQYYPVPEEMKGRMAAFRKDRKKAMESLTEELRKR